MGQFKHRTGTLCSTTIGGAIDVTSFVEDNRTLGRKPVNAIGRKTMENLFPPPYLRFREPIQSTPTVSAAVLRRAVKLSSVKNNTCHRYSTIGSIVGKIVKNRFRPCSS